MRRCDRFLCAVFLISITFLCGPVLVAGQFVEIGLDVSGSDSVSQTFMTDIDWADVYANPDVRYTWNLTNDNPGGVTIDLGTHDVFIENISVSVKGDPKIELGFSAVSNNGPANFLFTSDVLVFDSPLANAEAYVYATASALPGTTVSALGFPGKLCRNLYNGTEIFADVVNPFSFVPGGVYEYIASTPIAGEVSSMQVMWNLGVNSGGHATGLCTFEITGDVVPEPATIALLAIGGLVLRRKK